jgi:hypothetical protein
VPGAAQAALPMYLPTSGVVSLVLYSYNMLLNCKVRLLHLSCRLPACQQLRLLQDSSADVHRVLLLAAITFT